MATATAAISVVSLPAQQCTLGARIAHAGIGLHSGQETQICLRPAPANTGRVFIRTDLPDQPPIPAQVTAVRQTLLSTELGAGTATIRTVEHLLAALTGSGVDNVYIDVSGGEIPLLDGSALPWVELIQQVGVISQATPRTALAIATPLWIREEDAFVVAMPAPEPRYTYGIDFDLPAIGNQWSSWSPANESFATAVAPARTFGLAHQIDYLKSQGLIQGGSLENALVCDQSGWLNPPLRFDNEPARHKLLDLVGDLSLLGTLPQAHVIAYKASHTLHVRLAQALAIV
jgi:UDP-3-O-[3-hydroxymyristoyl] N-acetylglucosamine deacetylase